MKKTNAKQRGRPPKPAVDKRDDYLDVRLDSAEKQAFKQAAEIAGLPLSNWVRERLRACSRRELQEAGHPVPFLKTVDQFLEESSNGKP